jgi:hypothetical protein
LSVRPVNWPEANKLEKTSGWTVEETERMLEALANVNEVLWLGSIKGFHRMDKSIFPNNHASGTPGHIVLYNSAFGENQNLARILTHELAHEYYRGEMNLTEQVGYNVLSGWRIDNSRPSNGPKKWRSTRSKFVDADGSDSPEEDFANNVEYFFFNKTKLQFLAPEPYSWIEQRFNDKVIKEKRKK